MANGNGKTLTAEQELKLRQPIEDYVGKIHSKFASQSMNMLGKSRRRSMNFVLTVLKKLSISRMSWIT